MFHLDDPRPAPVLPAWEPGLSQLRTLPALELHPVLRQWLERAALQAVRVLETHPGHVTYAARLGTGPVSLPLHVRLYRRRNRLQLHHLEAFVGHLMRHGIPAGVLITTGECTRDVRKGCRSPLLPHVRVLDGSEFATELAYRKPGLRPAQVRGWLLDLRTTLFPNRSR